MLNIKVYFHPKKNNYKNLFYYKNRAFIKKVNIKKWIN